MSIRKPNLPVHQESASLRDNPDIFVPDPLNPNSTANVEKVLLHIEKISGIKMEYVNGWL